MQSDAPTSSSASPAAARYLFVLAEGFDETVIDSQVVDSIVALREEGIRFDVLSLVNARTWLRRLSFYRRRRREIAARTGTRVSIWPVLMKQSAIGRIWGAAIVVLEAARRGGVSVIHARTDSAAQIVAGAARLLPGMRLVFDVRGDGEAEFLEQARRESLGADAVREGLARMESARTAGIAAAAHVLCVSNPLRALLVRRDGLDPERATVVPCAADERKFAPDAADRAARRAALGLADRFVLVYPGRLGRWHHEDATFAVARGVLDAMPDAYFLVITPDVERARELAGRVLPAGRYEIRSARHDEVPGYLRAADVGLLLRERDGVNRVACPTKFAEFVMSGLPVLISDEIGDCSDFVRDHRAGVVLESADPERAAKAVAELRAEPDDARRARIAAAGRARFSRQRYAAGLADVYRRLAGEAGAR
jgi:glycosyltransferase involved in cell wall biosynthesis